MMRSLYKYLLLATALFGMFPDVMGQCSMCRAVVESNLEGQGAGINNGIIYLMVFPYAAVVLIGWLIYKKYHSDKPVSG